MGFVRNRDQYASVRGGFLSLFPAAYGVHIPADAPALTSQGSDFLSPFPQPGGSRAHGRRSSVGERRSAKPCQPRVRIPPRPPRRIRCAGCQKWESPNLSSADSRQRPPAGIEPYPAVIWDSSLNGRSSGCAARNGAGSNPACPSTRPRFAPSGVVCVNPSLFTS